MIKYIDKIKYNGEEYYIRDEEAWEEINSKGFIDNDTWNNLISTNFNEYNFLNITNKFIGFSNDSPSNCNFWAVNLNSDYTLLFVKEEFSPVNFFDFLENYSENNYYYIKSKNPSRLKTNNLETYFDYDYIFFKDFYVEKMYFSYQGDNLIYKNYEQYSNNEDYADFIFYKIYLIKGLSWKI